MADCGLSEEVIDAASNAEMILMFLGWTMTQLELYSNQLELFAHVSCWFGLEPWCYHNLEIIRPSGKILGGILSLGSLRVMTGAHVCRIHVRKESNSSMHYDCLFLMISAPPQPSNAPGLMNNGQPESGGLDIQKLQQQLQDIKDQVHVDHSDVHFQILTALPSFADMLPRVHGSAEEHDLPVRPWHVPNVRRPHEGVSHLPQRHRPAHHPLLASCQDVILLLLRPFFFAPPLFSLVLPPLLSNPAPTSVLWSLLLLCAVCGQYVMYFEKLLC